MKQLNPNTGLPFKHGDIREDGFIFHAYSKTRLRKNGFFAEYWLSKEHFKLKKETSRKQAKKYAQTTRGRANQLLRSAKKRSINRNLKFDITSDWVEQKLIVGVCELTGLPFDFKSSKNTYRNPYAPSLDRINCSKGYTQQNVRVVLNSVNEALNEYGLEIMKPIFKILAKL